MVAIIRKFTRPRCATEVSRVGTPGDCTKCCFPLTAKRSAAIGVFLDVSQRSVWRQFTDGKRSTWVNHTVLAK